MNPITPPQSSDLHGRLLDLSNRLDKLDVNVCNVNKALFGSTVPLQACSNTSTKGSADYCIVDRLDFIFSILCHLEDEVSNLKGTVGNNFSKETVSCNTAGGYPIR